MSFAVEPEVGGSESSANHEPSLSALLERSLEPDALRAVRLAAELGAERGQQVYLVGGPVRDLLLGRLTTDVDLLVEGDGAPLAEALAASLGGDWQRHPEFLTATIVAAGLKIDLASARAEVYSEPAALPGVRPGSIAEDLTRRDFTVNALALRLGPVGAPALIDPCGGRDDLDRRRLRVLHDRSFEDDPTRILRGVRFEARLGFRFDAAAEGLARGAAARAALSRLSGSRLLRELRRLAAESAAPAAFGRLGDLGALAAIDPGLTLSEPARDLLAGVAEGLAWSRDLPPGGPRPDPWRTYLVALLQCHPELPAERLTHRLDLSGRERDRVVGVRHRLAQAARQVAVAALAPHQVSAALAGLGVEELLVLRASAPLPAAERVEAELRRHRPLELGICGADLLARGHAPGPAIGRALAATRNARLDGRIRKTGELDFALGELSKDRAAEGPEE